MAFTAIRTAINDGVMTITLSRPERLNAFTSVMHAELREALSAAEHDASVRCVVLTGEGRAFSAGQDLTEDRLPGPDGKADYGARLERDYNPLVERIYAFPKVTIAALNGIAYGGGLELAGRAGRESLGNGRKHGRGGSELDRPTPPGRGPSIDWHRRRSQSPPAPGSNNPAAGGCVERIT
jgi:hypothetical protein